VLAGLRTLFKRERTPVGPEPYRQRTLIKAGAGRSLVGRTQGDRNKLAETYWIFKKEKTLRMRAYDGV